MNKLRPDVDAYVQRHLTQFHAPLKQKTQFGFGGRIRALRPGEKILYGPDGKPFRVIENPDGGTQIEQDHNLHAVVRPQTLNVKFRMETH